MTILRKTKLVILLALVLFVAVLLLSPIVEAETPVPDGLYSAHVADDSSNNPVYMQVRIDGNNVVLGAGMYGPSTSPTRPPSTQLSSCLRTTTAEPLSEGDAVYTSYSGGFNINEMYALFKASTAIYDTNGNTITDTFPDAITEIAHGAFKGWTALTGVVVPSSVTIIGSDAFAASSVTSVDFSQATSLVDISSSTFNKCQSLQSIDLSNTLITRLQTSSFMDCPYLSSVKLPDTLTTIENTALMNTSSLTQLTIPPNVNYINIAAFKDFSASIQTKILKFTGDFDSSFYDMADDSDTYVKLLYPAGNPTWENSTLVQELVALGKAASYITTTPQIPPQTPAPQTSPQTGLYF